MILSQHMISLLSHVTAFTDVTDVKHYMNILMFEGTWLLFMLAAFI